MFTKVLNITLLVIISCLAITVRSAIIGCDPFPASTVVYGITQNYFVRDFHSTCSDSILDWTTGEEALEISAAMDNCASVSSASVYFSYMNSNTPNQYSMNISASDQYIFTYSIKWREEKTFCVVDLTGSEIGANEIVSIDMVDQNGLSNKPTEDLSAFATDQWYTRSFTINGSAINNLPNATFLRFGFSCFANLSDPETQVQRAYVNNIRFHRIGDVDFRTLYSHNQNCTACSSTAPAILEAYCNATTRGWEIAGPLNVSTVNFQDLVTVLGDVFTDELVLNHYLMEVTGCIYPRTPGGIVNVTSVPDGRQYYPTSYTIYLGPECNIDAWNIPFVHRFRSGYVFIEIGYQPARSYCATCNPVEYSSDTVSLILWIVLPVVCTVGLVVGLVVGIRRRLANRIAANLDAEMEVPPKEVEANEH